MTSRALKNALAFLRDFPTWRVFPTIGKVWPGESWNKKATTDPDKLRQLFQETSKADNYGVIPPKGYVVLDYDPYRQDERGKVHGSHKADRFYRRYLQKPLRSHPQVTSIHGGIHTYLKDPNEFFAGGSRMLPDMKGFDCKGHGNSYVIGPDNEKRVWKNSIRKLTSLNWLDTELIRSFRPKPVKVEDKGDYPSLSEAQVTDLLTYISPEMDMNRWIGIIAAIGDNFPDDPDLAIELADEWSRTGFDKAYTCPQYDIDGRGTTLRDIERKILRPKREGNLASVGTIVKLARENGYEGFIGKRLSGREAFKLTSKREYEEDDDDVIRITKDSAEYFPDYLVEGLIPRGVIAYLVARQNSGKTAMVAELATCVQGGLKFFGKQCEKGKVLILEKDDWRGMHRFLYGSMLKHGLKEIRVSTNRLEDLIDITTWDNKRIHKEVRNLADQCEEYDLVIFETVTSIFSAGKMDEAWARPVSNFFGALNEQLPNTTFLIVSHSARGSEVNTFGSSLLTHNADVEIKLDRDDKDSDKPIRLYTGKAREFHLKPVMLRFKSATHHLLPRSVGYLDIDTEATANEEERRAKEKKEDLAKKDPDKAFKEELEDLQDKVSEQKEGRLYTIAELKDTFELKFSPGFEQGGKFEKYLIKKKYLRQVIKGKVGPNGAGKYQFNFPEI